MNPLIHIIEPERLLLTWQLPDEQAKSRTRRVVAELVNEGEGKTVFRYLTNTPDFVQAKAAGFQGFPAFDVDTVEFTNSPIETFIRRLPPRNREDFAEFLAQHRLPSPFNYSDMALLGYTGAKLPSDGFALVPVFNAEQVPCDYLMEVAGLRHVYTGNIEDDIASGDLVSFESDQDNPVDQNALLVVCKNQKIGYVNRALLETFHSWLENHQIKATIERINGKPERRLVYIRINVV